MASGGSATRSASVRSFDFGTDDVLCSYDEYTQQMDQTFNGKRSDSLAKQDLHESRVGRPLTSLYGQPEEISREDVISAVEKCMKKYADNLTRNLEGISGRLTQLELYCFKLDRTIGEFRADMVREQSEADLKLKSLEKHIYEVHRSVQIIRDKQELSETQMELAELVLPQKKPTNSTHSQKKDEFLTTAAPEIKTHQDENDSSNLQLALTHPNQTTPNPDQNQPSKLPPMQHPAPTSFTVPPQDHYVLNQPNSYYTSHQPQNQNFQPPPFTQYRPQWSHPIQPLQSSSQPQAPSPQNPSLYARYLPNQPTNTIQTEAYQGSSMAPPASYITVPQSSNYGTSAGTIPHVASHHNMQQNPHSQATQVSFRPLPPPPPQSNMPSYNTVYVIDGIRAPHPHYPPSNNVSTPQILNNHPYGEMIDKAVSMGYPRDQVVGIVQVMGASGQTVDFNALLDRLNAIASGGMRRPWSG